MKSGRQGSNLQDLRPKHSVIPNRLLPVYIKDVLEMSILKKKKKGNKIPLFLNKLTKKLLFCILFLKIKNNLYRLFFYFIILFVLKTEKESVNNF